MQKSNQNSPNSSFNNLQSAPLSAHGLRRGRIELIIGPMFAGKSTELLRRVKRHEIAGSRCLRIKFSEDQRYSADSIATHDLQKSIAIGHRTLAEVGDSYKDYDVIGIDEGQFFPDVLEFVEKAANEGKVIIISALDGTYLRTGFDNIIQLIPKAEKVKKLAAICKYCNQSASFTFRTTSDQSLQLIGGMEAYMPLCRECFNHNLHKQNSMKLESTQTQEFFENSDAANEGTRSSIENSPDNESIHQ